MNSNLSLIFLKMPHPTQKDYMNIITITGIPQLTEGLCSKSLPVVKLSGTQITFSRWNNFIKGRQANQTNPHTSISSNLLDLLCFTAVLWGFLQLPPCTISLINAIGTQVIPLLSNVCAHVCMHTPYPGLSAKIPLLTSVSILKQCEVRGSAFVGWRKSGLQSLLRAVVMEGL